MTKTLYRVRSMSAARFILLVLIHAGTTLGQQSASDPQRQASSGPSIHANDKQAKPRREEDEFMRRYISLPPKEQVDIWRHADSHLKYFHSTVDWRMQTEMEYVLVIAGVASVPYLSDVLRTSDNTRQIRTLKLLSDMDRFVSDEEIIVDAARGGLYSKALGRGGRVNPFAPVDGHRIGKEGFEAIHWAAQQEDNELLKFYSKLFTGELRKELEDLPLAEQLRHWREAVIRCRIVMNAAQYPEDSAKYRLLETIFMEKMPDLIPPLVELLEHDKDPYVRSEIISIFARADLCSVRLRKIEAGRHAIEIVLSTLKQGPLAPFYNQGAYKQDLEHLRGQYLKDEIYIGRASEWAIYAHALQLFYGDNLIPDYNPKWIRNPIPELRNFVTYLTEKDPYFPRWGYFNCSAQPEDEVLHPRFREKIEHLHEEWKRFKAERP